MQQPAINLTFHGLGDPPRALADGEAAVWVALERFETMLDIVAARKDVRVTFDDGNASDVRLALPALRRRGLVATFFVVAGRLGEPGFLDAGDVRALAQGGMAIGSHGMRHRAWRTLDAATLHEELVDARHVLEDVTGAPVREAACPFGSYDRRVLRALRHGGYRHVYTSDRGPARSDRWLQPRTTVRACDDADAVRRIVDGDASAGAVFVRRAKGMVKRWR